MASILWNYNSVFYTLCCECVSWTPSCPGPPVFAKHTPQVKQTKTHDHILLSCRHCTTATSYSARWRIALTFSSLCAQIGLASHQVPFIIHSKSVALTFILIFKERKVELWVRWWWPVYRRSRVWFLCLVFTPSIFPQILLIRFAVLSQLTLSKRRGTP